MSPKVSVLMPVYNGAAYLSEAIESILNQDFTDFEFIIIDDASQDESVKIILNYADPRIRFFQNTTNIGQTKTLNRGIELARGHYLARQDQDDLSVATRLKQESEFLDKNSNIVIVGSASQIMDRTGILYSVIRTPLDDIEVRWHLLYRNPFSHPSVMIRREILFVEHLRYDVSYRFAQDYALWVELLRYGQGANIAQPLIHYRVHPTSTGRKNIESMLIEHKKIAHRAISLCLPEFQAQYNLTINDFLDLFVVRGEDSAPFKFHRVEVAQIGLSMYEAFALKYPLASSHYALQSRMLLDVLFAVLRPPLSILALIVAFKTICRFPQGMLSLLFFLPSSLKRVQFFQSMRLTK